MTINAIGVWIGVKKCDCVVAAALDVGEVPERDYLTQEKSHMD